MRLILLFSLVLCMISVNLFGQSTAEKSTTYLQQPPPGMTPEVFAPGIVSLEDEYEFGSVFSKDAMHFFYGVDIAGKAEIRYMQFKNNAWTKPERLIFHTQFSYNDPFLSPDENKLFFISDMPLDGTGEKKDYDIWYVERNGNEWSQPINAGEAINTTHNEYYISFTEEGDLYFASNKLAGQENPMNYDIYVSANEDGVFQPAVPLGDAINSRAYEADVFVAPDASYLIFSGGRAEGYGRGDLYISFLQTDGSWTKAKNMGAVINTSAHELCPFVSADGKYFFYSSNKDIYWVDAQIINSYR